MPKTLLLLLLCSILAGCGGYSLKLVHEPSTLTALQTVEADLEQVEEEMLSRYDDLFDQVEPWIPTMVAHARQQGQKDASTQDTYRDFADHRLEFRKATALITRSRVMAEGVRESLGIDEEPAGNLEGAGAFLGGCALGAAAAAAF